MPTQHFGRWTTLDPPVTVGGVQYSLALKLADPFANRTQAAESIVSGIIDAATDLGDGTWRVKCRRAYRQTSQTVVPAPGEGYEAVTASLCGGNIAVTPEPMRIYSWLDSTARRGCDARSRAIPGDVLRLQVGAVTRDFLILAANCYAIAPTSVNWEADTPLPIITYKENTSYELILDVEDVDLATIPTADDGIWKEPILHAVDTGPPAVEQLLTRKIFSGEPEYYPPDASFDPAGFEYWLDPTTYRIMLSSYVSNAASNVRARYWVVGLEEFTVEADEPVGVRPSAACSYGTGSGGADEVLLAALLTDGDFDESLEITEGSGALEWRRGIGERPGGGESAPWTPEAGLVECATLRWVSQGADASISTSGGGARIEYAGGFANQATVAGTLTYPFHVRCVKSGGTLTLYHSPDGVAWTAAFSVVMTDVSADHDGLLSLVGMDTDGVTAEGFAGDLRKIAIGKTGNLGVRREVTENDLEFFVAYTLPSSNAISEVLNLTTGEEMTKRADPGDTVTRAMYDRVGDVFYAWGEGAGDRYKITQEADVAPPSGPGTPPRVFNIKHFADGGTATADNRANWSDELIISDPLGEFTGTPADVFTVHRSPVIDTETAATIETDIRNAVSDWASAAGNYLVSPVDGIILFKKSYIDTIENTQRFCARIFGNLYRQACGIEARTYNDAARVVEVLDSFWHAIGVAGGESPDVSVLGIRAFGASGYSCTAYGWVPNDCVNGLTKGQIAERVDFFEARGGLPPGYVTDAMYYGLAGNTVIRGSDLGGDHCGTDYHADEFDIVAGEFLYGFNMQPPPGVEYAGNLMDTIALPAAPMPSVAAKHRGVPFVPAAAVNRLAGLGAEIIEAKIRIKVDDLESWDWGWSVLGTYEDYEYTASRNGTLESYEKYQNEILVESYYGAAPPMRSGGYMGFELFGLRKNSGPAYLCGNPAEPIWPYWSGAAPRSLGSSFGTNITPGIWQVVDCTGAMQALCTPEAMQLQSVFLWPTVGLSPGVYANPSGVASYVSSLFSQVSDLEYAFKTGNPRSYSMRFSETGRYAQWTSLEVGEIWIRYRLPGDRLTSEYTLPITRKPFRALSGS